MQKAVSRRCACIQLRFLLPAARLSHISVSMPLKILTRQQRIFALAQLRHVKSGFEPFFCFGVRKSFVFNERMLSGENSD